MTGASDGKRDFFISFNKADRPWATWIAWVLEEKGYSVFFQDWDFKGNFVLEMDRAHTQSRRTIAVISPDYLTSRFTAPEWAARFADDATSEHDLLIPVRVRPCEYKGLLAQIVYVDFVACDEAAARARLLSRIRGIRIKPDESPAFPGPNHKVVTEQPAFPSPYPGLPPFKPEQAPFFFGRKRETDELVIRLQSPDCRFLAIVGASGTGKSSLIYAGLIPRLRAGDGIEGSEAWLMKNFRPGSLGDNPFLALAAYGLEPYLQQYSGKADDLARELEKSPGSIIGFADQVLAGAATKAKLVLFIDQLEELFTQATEKYRKGFIDLLAEAVRHPRVRILTTLREDFLSYALQYPKLADLSQTQTATFPLSRPGDTALREIIRCPAERVGLAVEDVLVEEIVRDAGNDLGALPLLAFCLEELWKSIDRDAPQPRMTLAAYKNIGQLQGAIGKYADNALEDLRTNGGADFDQALEEIIFPALVTVEAEKAIRRRAARTNLNKAGQLVDQLITKRLLCAQRNKRNNVIIELAQDALLDRWPTLKRWIDAHRSDMIHLTQLRAAVCRWRNAPRRHRHVYLWRGHRLRDAKKLANRWKERLGHEHVIIASFIKASEIRTWRNIAVLCAAGATVSVFLTIITLRYITPSLVHRGPMPVGRYKPNAFQLHDMHGNVWEWTSECGQLNSPQPPVTFCVARGGSWDNHEKLKIRADYWEYFNKLLKANTVGFRLVREMDGDEDVARDCKKCPQMEKIDIDKQYGLVTPPRSEEEPCKPGSATALAPAKKIAIGKFEVTVAEWDECDTCTKRPADDKQRKERPVINVTQEDAQKYATWISKETKKRYRLPTPSEWEYAARGGNDKNCYHWGDEIGSGNANCEACGLTWEQLFDLFGPPL